MPNSFDCKSQLTVGNKTYTFYDLRKVANQHPSIKQLPFSLRILLENLLRHEDDRVVTKKDIAPFLNWDPKATPDQEISFHPARVLLQDFTGVPCVADLAAMRDAIKKMGGDPSRINPLQPVDLVIDHSVQVDAFGKSQALDINTGLEFQRNGERYVFLRWGQHALKNFSVVPPGTGICHQVNLEYLAQVAFVGKNDIVYPDTLVGTDSHTVMINGAGVLGWGVGGIEAEAAMLGQPISMLIPQVVGFKLTGKLPTGATATDLVLTATQMLRKKGVVGKFVEFYGSGVRYLSLADRATIANMAPEYGATMGYFPVDEETLKYLRLTNRSAEQVALTAAYYQAQDLFYQEGTPDPVFSDYLELKLEDVVPCVAGPKRPQDRVPLNETQGAVRRAISALSESKKARGPGEASVTLGDKPYTLSHGAVVIAAITSCTNTSNPAVMLAAGLLAQKAVQKGLRSAAWVKTSLAPGSQVVTDYLQAADVTQSLETLGFHTIGYGCTTCIGNSGPLPDPVSEAIKKNDLLVASVLSGNRNFEGRVHPQVQLNFLASPPLVVAYAIAGRTDIDFDKEPLGKDAKGANVFLRDVWPSQEELQGAINKSVQTGQFQRRYSAVFQGDKRWQELKVPAGEFFAWDDKSTYVRRPPFFENIAAEPAATVDIKNARVLAVLGDSVTTDHISPAGSIAADSPAARYLRDHGVESKDFNSYGARRGNHEVMMRGTFANIRLKNFLVPGVEGNHTLFLPTGQQMSIYDAAMEYQKAKTPLIVLAGAEYGTGSSRDWAAKGVQLLGVKAVIAKSFERIHRSNLVGMGVLPLQFLDGEDATSLGLTGKETFEISGIAADLHPGKKLAVHAALEGRSTKFTVTARIDTPNEVDYYKHGGILVYVLRQLIRRN